MSINLQNKTHMQDQDDLYTILRIHTNKLNKQTQTHEICAHNTDCMSMGHEYVASWPPRHMSQAWQTKVITKTHKTFVNNFVYFV